MIRKIVDYQKLNEDILTLLTNKFPDGYDDDDVITFRNAQNEIVEAVEVRTEDTVYLVKVGKRLIQAMEDFDLDDDDGDKDNDDGDDFDTSDLNDQD
ncbi:hypothetical protein [Hyunsoonleella ulvae]|uniref:hypothetical protein n=1 Tax=Hyunsoonleella ulvae TaxID=2799948 RepID=UPI00193A55F5|nr:hypothetical protein [Hyunsoonleella ulvae]